MEKLPLRPDVTPIQRASVDLLRTELDVGSTFVDIPKGARHSAHARWCLRIVLKVLRTTDRCITQRRVYDADIHERGKQLWDRLRETARGLRTREC
jgi:hypothetical protein